MLYAPAAALALALASVAGVSMVSGNISALFALVIVGILALALSYQAITAISDLRATPITTQGEVSRLWRKSRVLFFGRVHYLFLDRRVFEIGPVAFQELHEGDTVEIHHWPNTNTLISLRLLEARRGSQSRGSSSPPPGR